MAAEPGGPQDKGSAEGFRWSLWLDARGVQVNVCSLLWWLLCRRAEPSSVVSGDAECFLSDVGSEHLKCHRMDGSHQSRGSEGGSGDLEWQRWGGNCWPPAAAGCWVFCFDGGEGRHVFPSQEPDLCVLVWAQGFYSF